MSRVPVGMKIGIINTIAKSIYADPKVKIREAVANSMDNAANWFILFADLPSETICLMDDGTGITEKRFDEIFSNIGYGLKRGERYSNSYFGLGLMSILELGKKAIIITKSEAEGKVIKVEINTEKIFSAEMEKMPVSDISSLIDRSEVDLSERTRLSAIEDSELDRVIGELPEHFTEIILQGVNEADFKYITSMEFEIELRKILPLAVQENEPFFQSIKDAEALKWIKELLQNSEYCPKIDVYMGISEGQKELSQIWKYYPGFKKELEFGTADIIKGTKSYKDSENIERAFAYYYLQSIEDLEERSKRNIETGLWIRNKNFLVKEADYLEKPGSRERKINEPLRNWLFGEIFHKGMTDFLVVTRNEYNWESDNFKAFFNAVYELLKDINVTLRSAWKHSTDLTESIIKPFVSLRARNNAFSRCFDTLSRIGIIDKHEKVDEILELLHQVREPELEDEEKSIDKMVQKYKGEILLADDESVKVIIDPVISHEREFTRHREEDTNRVIVRISPYLFSPQKVNFLSKSFEVFFVLGEEGSKPISVNKDSQKIFVNPFGQNLSKYSVSFIEIYLAVELAAITAKDTNDMKRIILDLVGVKTWEEHLWPEKYLFSLKDELQRVLRSS